MMALQSFGASKLAMNAPWSRKILGVLTKKNKGLQRNKWDNMMMFYIRIYLNDKFD